MKRIAIVFLVVLLAVGCSNNNVVKDGGSSIPDRGLQAKKWPEGKKVTTENGHTAIEVGDMLFKITTDDKGAFPAFSFGYPWRNGVLYYSFDNNVKPAWKNIFLEACNNWSEAGRVRCEPRTTQRDYVFVTHSNINQSHIGRAIGRQVLKLKSWDLKTIRHELGHAFGFLHEHQRDDRDKYVIIHKQNIRPSSLDQFEQVTSKSYGPYDFWSIMHYDRLAYSKNGKNTITVKPPYTDFTSVIGTQHSLSEGDELSIAERYKNGGDILGGWCATRHSRGLKFCQKLSMFECEDYGSRRGVRQWRFCEGPERCICSFE